MQKLLANRIHRLAFLFLALLPFSAPMPTKAQKQDAASWAASAADQYWVYPDRQYAFAGNTSLKLDVWQNRYAKGPVPTVIYIHGGGWFFGDRTGALPKLLPYLERGWNVINVEYRMSGNALAPAAVEDCRCALRWVYRNAKEYGLDTDRIVVTGHSAGGHLALMTGMLTPEAGLDNECPGSEVLKVSAIVNWFGVTDVEDLLSGPNMKDYALAWLGSISNRNEVAKRVSPLTHVRADLPPIITIHGDADPTVPYSHAVRLHQALAKIGAPNELVTIRGGEHGSFAVDQTQAAFSKIWLFLAQHAKGFSNDTSK